MTKSEKGVWTDHGVYTRHSFYSLKDVWKDSRGFKCNPFPRYFNRLHMKRKLLKNLR